MQVMMMAYERSESTLDNFGEFTHLFQPETWDLAGSLKGT